MKCTSIPIQKRTLPRLSRVMLLLLTIFAIISCNEKPLTITSEGFSETTLDACKKVTCPEITVDYFEVAGDEEIAKMINGDVQQFISDALYLGDEEELPKATSVSDAAEHFIKMYRIESAEFPDMAAEYFAEISISNTISTPNIFSVEMRQYLYTGGAHGYGSVTFKNYDPQTGAVINNDMLFNDHNAFTRFAEKAFRKTHEISESASLNEAGFWFEDDIFQLPETIGFTKEHLILHYNQYEIASYAAGPIEVEIPLEEAAPFLTFNPKD